MDNITAFFCERFVTGCPCDVPLGAIADDLLALKPDEKLERDIDDIEVIFACQAPKTLGLDYPETVLYFLNAYRHGTTMLIVSQEKLRQAICRSIVAV
jgi:hypothetical protein